MGVDEVSSRRVQFFNGSDTLADIHVGNTGRGGVAYIRLPADDAVYAVKGSLSRFAGRAANDWRDRSFAAVPTDSVQTVDVTRHDGRYTIERADSAQWTVNDNPADSSSVMRVIGASASTTLSTGCPRIRTSISRCC